MHVKSKFNPCQNRVHLAICAVLNSLLLEIPTDLKSCSEYAFVKACYSFYMFKFIVNSQNDY